jgi:myo-inositol 2-dehydrogenase / D-chiro-inositol 1-dehydrogenase
MTMRIGVIGAGIMGAEHARLIREETRGAALAAVCDADAARALAACGGGDVFTDPLELIGSDKIDAVIIASPDATHSQLAIACINAGKPVLCEKPLGITGADSLRVIEAETLSGKSLVQVGYMRRFDPAYGEMRNAVHMRSLGAPVLLHNIHRNQAAPDWFVGAMPLTNSFVHEIDISRWLLDEEFTFGTLRASIKGDPMMVTLETDKGQLVSTEVFMNAAYGYHVHAELVCSGGTIAMAQPGLTLTNQQNNHGHRYPENWVPRFTEAYRRQMEAFVRFAKTGLNEGATAWDGYVATATAEQLVPALNTRNAIEFSFAKRP